MRALALWGKTLWTDQVKKMDEKKTLDEMLKEHGINHISFVHKVVDCVSVPIPKGMFDEIVQIIEDCPEYGYEGPTEFVRESVRRSLLERF
jgi:hypothetical protein